MGGIGDVKHPLINRLSGFWGAFGHAREERYADGNQPGEILMHVENVVDDTDGRIRLPI